MIEPANLNNVVSFLWAIADLLNGAFQKSEFQKTIFPFTVLRRLDYALEATKAKVFLYGQELNPQTWAIARSDMLILEPEGKDAENIKLPVCFWFAGRNNTLDPANVTRLFAGETKLSLVA